MKLAAAQTHPFGNNTTANIQTHFRLAELAARNGAGLIVFPEMSLTGYQRELAGDMAFEKNDARLNELKELAALHNIIIIAGAPISLNSRLHIGAFVLLPNGDVSIYTKQFLHKGEEAFFVPSFDFNPLITLGEEKIALAICSDISNPLHAEHAEALKTTLYVAGIFYTPGGISKGHCDLSERAKKHNMQVLMANYSGPSWNLEAGGNSAFWNSSGSLIAKSDNTQEGLLLVEKKDGAWTGHSLNINS